MTRFWRRKPKEQRGYLEAQQQFEAHGLPFPYIPEEMRDDFGRLSEWVYGAGHNGRGLLDIGAFVDAALTGPQADFVLLGQDGRGIQSYAMHYYLAKEPLYLFLQIGYGGAYTDNEAAIESMKGRYLLAERLIKRIPAAVREGGLGPDERWVIGDSDFYGRSWERLNCIDPQDDGRLALDESRGVLEQGLERLGVGG